MSHHDHYHRSRFGHGHDYDHDGHIHPVREAIERQSGQSEKTGREFWRSLEELADTDKLPRLSAPRISRPECIGNRSQRCSIRPDAAAFMKLMSASLALAGLTACTVPAERRRSSPYVKTPDGLVPGKPQFYATAMTIWRRGATGCLVESHQGRPTKVEGNPGSSRPA